MIGQDADYGVVDEIAVIDSHMAAVCTRLPQPTDIAVPTIVWNVRSTDAGSHAYRLWTESEVWRWARATGQTQTGVEIETRSEVLTGLAAGIYTGASALSTGRLRLGGDIDFGKWLVTSLKPPARSEQPSAASLLVKPRSILESLRAASVMGASAVVMLLIMFLASFGLWVGVPFSALWIGSQVQASSNSIGLAILVAGVVAIVFGFGVLQTLQLVDRRYSRMRASHGLDADTGTSVLEAMMVLGGACAVAAFAVWFLIFSGADVATARV